MDASTLSNGALYGAGKILNAKTARSRLAGGIATGVRVRDLPITLDRVLSAAQA